jgi:DNA repair exonuclease SbcCD nuclease subunit
MTRILAFADTQIGVGTVDLQDQRAVIDKIIHVALDRQVDAVLHGGDVFEGPIVMPEHMRLFLDATRPLRDAGIPMLVIRGNGRHDMAVRDVHALDFLRELDLVSVSDSPSVAVLAEKVAVCTLPWVHAGRLIAASNGGLTHDQANKITAEKLVQIAKHLRGRADEIAMTTIKTTLPTVLLAHWAISNTSLANDLPVEQMREPVLPWAELDALGYDAIIGAHIHHPQQISQPIIDETLGIVVGAPQQLNHGDKGNHGCWIIDFASTYDDPTRAEFVSIPSPHFITVDLTDEDGTLVPLHELPQIIDGDSVRIRYTVTEKQQATVDLEETKRRVLRGSIPRRVQVEPKIIRRDRARAEEISEQLSQIDALEQWCEANNVDEAMRRLMRDTLTDWGGA